MTKEQLNALRQYVWAVSQHVTEQRLNPEHRGPSQFESNQFEQKFEDIMLDK